MKKSELRQIIREEIQKVLNEENLPSLKNLIDKKFRFHGVDYMIIAVDDDPKNPIIATNKKGKLARFSEDDIESVL